MSYRHSDFVSDGFPPLHCSLENSEAGLRSPECAGLKACHLSRLLCLTSLLSPAFCPVFPVHSASKKRKFLKIFLEKDMSPFRARQPQIKYNRMFSRGRPEASLFPFALFLTLEGCGRSSPVCACYFCLSLASSLRVSSLPVPILNFFVSDVGIIFLC